MQVPAAITSGASGAYGFITNNAVANTITSLFAKYVGFVAKFTSAAAAPWVGAALLLTVAVITYKYGGTVYKACASGCSSAYNAVFGKKAESEKA